jgi:hypothetical protein
MAQKWKAWVEAKRRGGEIAEKDARRDFTSLKGAKNGKPEFFFASFLGILAADDFLSCFSYLLFPFQLYPQPRGVSEEEAGRDF